eukprot:1004835-Karenia_brevis.AAC.1
MKRHHPEYGPETLRLKAFLLTSSKLLPRPSEDEILRSKLRTQLEKLQGKHHGKMGARQLFRKDLM